MKKDFKIFCIVFVFLLLISFNIYADDANPEQILKVGIGTDIGTFDVIKFTSSNDMKAASLVFETLITLDPNDLGMPVPLLATSWKQINEITWIFNLRKGVKFIDGTPFNAAAVKFSLERAITALKSSRFQGMIKVVNIINDYQVEIKLKEPSSSFFTGLSRQTASIISPTAVKKYGEDWFKNPVGTGMFKLEEWIPGRYVAFTRNEDYWGTPAKLEKVVFYPIVNEDTRLMSFKSGEINVCEDLPAYEVPNIEADPNLNIQIQPQLRTIFLTLNTLCDTLKDIRVRKAIALAIDKEGIFKYVMEGIAPEAKYGLFPPQILTKDEPIGYGYDPELAKKLLAEAGYADGLELELWVPEGRYAKGVEICKVVQGQLSKVGIKVNISIMESGSFWELTSNYDIDKKFQMLLIGWLLPPDPFPVFLVLFNSDSNVNFSNYRFPGFEARNILASRTADKDERDQIYLDMDKEVVEYVAIIPIYYGAMIYGVNAEVQEFAGHPMDYLLIADTWIK